MGTSPTAVNQIIVPVTEKAHSAHRCAQNRAPVREMGLFTHRCGCGHSPKSWSVGQRSSETPSSAELEDDGEGVGDVDGTVTLAAGFPAG